MKMRQYIPVIACVMLINVFLATGHHLFATDEPVNPYTRLQDSRQKIDSINNWISKIYRSNPTIAQKNGIEAYSSAIKLDYTEGQKNLAHTLGNAFRQSNKHDSALIFTEIYLSLAKKTSDSLAFAKGYFQMSKLLGRLHGVDTAIEYAMKAKNIFTKLDHERGMLVTANTLGNLYKNKTLYDEAVSCYHEALLNSEKLRYSNGIGAALNNLGKVYLLMEEDSIARNYFLRSIPYNIKSGNIANESIAYTNLGIVEMKEEHYDSAMIYFEKSLKLKQQLDDKIGEINLYINQGTVYFQQDEYRKALETFNLALDTLKNVTHPVGFITALSSKAQTLSRLGQSNVALQLLDSSFNMAVEFGFIDLQKDILNKYYEYYMDRKDYKNAVKYQTEFYLTKDSIWNDKKKKNIEELRMKYEREKDQARILALTNDNLEKDLILRKRTNQRNIYLFSTAGIVLIAIFIFIFYRVKSKNDNYLAMQRIRQLEKDKKLISVQFLLEGQEEERKRIAKELHDGIGVLLSTAKMQFTSIDGVSPKSKPKINNATKLLEMAASEVRKITHNMMPGLLTRYGFFEAIDELIEQINESEAVKAEMIVEGPDKRFSERKEFMLYRIVQEMINNSLKHAEANHIKLFIRVKESEVHIEFEDDGKGFNVYEKMNNNSLGLTSIKSRSDYLGGLLKLDSSPGKGTKYTFDVKID